MLDLLTAPWPWYVTGPLIGLVVPALLVAGNRPFGFSSNLRHLCAIGAPIKPSFLRYDWRNAGGWNLVVSGGGGAGRSLHRLADPVADDRDLRSDARDLAALGVGDFTGYVPASLFSWSALPPLVGWR